jgi:catechol 2,3-dioxygenase-like lactoylglutathione lyase family enzyme
MTIQLDHTIVPSHNQVASAKFLAELLGVPWAATGVGPFSPVYVNDGFTLDFSDTGEDFPIYHFCFRVEPAEFNAILARLKAAGIPYGSKPDGVVDMQIGTPYGNIYWYEPDGHYWEILTVSYARLSGQQPALE